MPATFYPIRAVSRLTGIEVDTLRAWERRYHAVTPTRTARGRAYTDDDIRRLILLRAAVDAGHSISQVAALTDTQLEALARTSFPEVRPAGSAPLVDVRPVINAVERFDVQSADAHLNRFALLLNSPALVHHVVLPLMQETGEKWEHGSFRIAQEHLLSACLRNLLGGMVRLHKPAQAGPMLFTTPAGELHEFGILAAAMLAAAHEFPAIYLGPNLPAGEILSAAAKCGARVVVLGITGANATVEVGRDLAAIAARSRKGTELWVGGSGALEASKDTTRENVLLISDLAEFERHLIRRKSASRRS